MTEKLYPPEIDDLLEVFKQKIFAQLNCIQIGSIKKYTPGEQTAEIQIVMKARYGDDKIISYPLLVDCPVFVLQGGGAFIEMPISVGDTCIVLFNDRDIDIWWQSGNNKAPNTTRKHSLSDGIALVGINAKNKVLNLDGTKVQIQASGFDLDMTADAINLNGDSKALVTHSELNTALQTFVTALNALFATKMNGAGAAGTLTLDISGAATTTIKTGG